jgi:hypothetical protein
MTVLSVLACCNDMRALARPVEKNVVRHKSLRRLNLRVSAETSPKHRAKKAYQLVESGHAPGVAGHS